MKFKSFLFQNPVGFLSAIIFLVAGFGFLFIDKKGAIAAFFGFVIVLPLFDVAEI